MEIKRFLADNVREGMLSVRSVLGPDAVILSNRRIGDKIEILATNEFEAESLDVSIAESREFTGRAVAAVAADPEARQWSGTAVASRTLADHYGFTDIDGTLPAGPLHNR